ncbi:MAG: hypothetical protein QOD06_744 [Candidatus Binatota bacterium]|nr:hypothetical protein [Candidatus Binatota bacterium]
MSERAKPLLVWDGDCGFCRRWIDRWREITGDAVAYDTYQNVAAEFPEVDPQAFERAVTLIEPGGRVSHGAEAVFRALAAGGRRAPLRAYEHVPGFGFVAERAYRVVAGRRRLFSRVTALLWGAGVARPSSTIGSCLFLRVLGGIYAIAFVSLWVQVEGLVGERGILPAARFLSAVPGWLGTERYWWFPTVLWLGAGDGALHAVCALGTAAAALAAAGIAPALALAACWILYLSVFTVGGEFLQYQWDILLLECGFLAVFLAPLEARDRLAGRARESRVMVWCLRWLLFRLMFSSGAVKLLSGDPLWWGLAALRVHYETQPLPTWVGWYAHQLPVAAHVMSCAAMFAIELVVPLLFFLPARARLWAAVVTAAFQVVIAATGNYGFFNVLAIALCILLVDDASWPDGLRRKAAAPRRPSRRWPAVVIGPIAAVVLSISTGRMLDMMVPGFRAPEVLLRLNRLLSPFALVNGYGLFAVMTPRRPEIVIEGSDDGREWRAYDFRWKPGDLAAAPRFVAPHQPRLDWQMWFAALGRYDDGDWFERFLQRLLEGSPNVLALLARDPFPEHPPRYVRAMLWDYRFTDPAEKAKTGRWWRRQLLGPYSPVLSLREGKLFRESGGPGSI